MNPSPLTEFGNPILRLRARAISLKSLSSRARKALIRRMFDVMKKVHGVGIAAPQIGKTLQLAVIHLSPTPLRPRLWRGIKMVIVNPKILRCSRSTVSDWEGCLSLPGIRARVPRARWVKVIYWDERGQQHTKIVRGFEARVFQHEIDHLKGVLFIDRVRDIKTVMSLAEFKKRVLRLQQK